MLNSLIHIRDLKPIFKKNREVEREQLVNFIKQKTGLESSTYLINKLLKDEIIHRTGYGKYALKEKKDDYMPELNAKEKEIYQLIKLKKSLLDVCIWRTSIVNEFSLHQPGIFSIIVEVEKVGVDAVFNLLRDNFENVYVKPSREVLDNYVSYQQDAIVVIPLISESPLINVDEVRTISLEKLLVDLVSENKLYEAFQGAELTYIFQEALSKYTFSKTKLLRYANRRGIKEQLEKKILSLLS
ncbi:DUF6577 family protein [Arcicella sp. LKC2W]|uniref:DUF6577 family protein n=1 Tax=Arcicella sp. LKC2W TaxID=2984198 RepID=UPI002B20927E|nr:DUF6577 family protein [Arcicella sp. LKC2W]MEA5461625.1 DUF6577 family protein [Arcicella sp. LKC2W]